MAQPVVGVVPGTATALIGASTWLLVDVPPDSETVVGLSQALQQDEGPSRVLDALATTGLSQLPSFALLAISGTEARAFVRGDAVIAVTKDGVASDLVGSGLTTWRESTTTLSDVAAIRMSIGRPEPSDIRPAIGGPIAAAALELTWPPVGSAPAPELDAGTIQWNDTTSGAVEPVAVVPPEPPVSAPASPAVATEPAPPSADSDNYDFLFGSTTSRTIEDAAVRDSDDEELDDLDSWAAPATPAPPTPPPAAASASPPPAPPLPDNEDFATRVRQPSEVGLPPLGPDAQLPTVMAVLCTERHPNPTHASVCRLCGGHIPPQDATAVPRPPLGQLVISNGATVVLDRNVILGRSPAWQPPGERPHLIKLVDPTGEMSRSHVEVGIDGWNVTIHDLGSTNGTMITLPGRPPQLLGRDEHLPIPPGTTVELADDVSFVYEARQR